MPTSTVIVLLIGALILGAVAVIVDRLNFPQRRFVARKTVIDREEGRARDRTGAHIIDREDTDT